MGFTILVSRIRLCQRVILAHGGELGQPPPPPPPPPPPEHLP